MAKMYEANMRDFVVWLHEESGTMFHQFHYVGDDFDADMKKCAAAPALARSRPPSTRSVGARVGTLSRAWVG
jgi:L-rhamnose mutarotase